jgi:hypothetical protein
MILRFTKLSFIFVVLLSLSTGVNAKDEHKNTEIIVGFIKTATDDDIKTFEKKFSLKAVKKFKRIYAIRYQIPMSENCKKIIAKVQQEQIVSYAEKK